MATCCTMPLEVKLSDLIRMGLVSSDGVTEGSNESAIEGAIESAVEDFIEGANDQEGDLADKLTQKYSRKEIQKIVKQLQKQGVIKNYRESTGLFLMNSKPNGDCQYLDSNRKCTIYTKRPQVCVSFPEKMGLKKGFCPYIRK